jgi:hypothetical protein
MSMLEGQRLRAWLLAGRLLIAVVTVVIVAGTLSNLPVLAVVLADVVIAMTGSWLIDPRRTWWGPEPAAVLADPTRKRDYRKRELLMAVVIVVGLLVGLTAVWTALAG